jgi:molybdopterin-guanine dinucleotide biosynthesis protein A
MGRDKGLLMYDGVPAVARAVERLSPFCERTFVSVRHDQADAPTYARLPLIIDAGEHAGPAAGLLSAWQAHPDSAWLVVAADMPGVDSALLAELVAARAPACLATAFVNDTGLPEPLCAIWEPAAAPVVSTRAQSGRLSLREVLDGHRCRLLACKAPAKLKSVDTAASYAAFSGPIES